MQWYKHNDIYYIIHRKFPISNFASANGIINLELVKEGRDTLFKVDHVLKTESHFLFVETIKDAEIIKENDSTTIN
jgi:hypothetical protein